MTDRTLLGSLQVFRGIAATAVVAHHAEIRTSAFVGPGPLCSDWMKHGALGVDFFFVLSGFIIFYAHGDDPPTGQAVRRYVTRRAVRIFPAYLPISIVLLLAYSALPSLSAAGGREFSIVSSLLLVPANLPPALSVAWTLVHEMVFYAVFLVFYISRRIFTLAIIIWSILNLLPLFGLEVHGWARYVVSPLNLDFVFGMAAAVAARQGLGKGRLAHVISSAGILIVASTVALAGTEAPGSDRVLLGFGMALLLFGMASRDRQAEHRYAAPMLLVGSASYAIYLVHNPLLSLSQRVMAKFGLGWWTSFGMGVALSLLAGLAYYRYMEKPLLHWIRSWPVVSRLSQPAKTAARCH